MLCSWMHTHTHIHARTMHGFLRARRCNPVRVFTRGTKAPRATGKGKTMEDEEIDRESGFREERPFPALSVDTE